MLPVHSYLRDFLHLFFPHNCVGCGSDILEDDQQLCYHCISALPTTNFIHQPGNPVEKIFYGRIPVRNAGSNYFFTKESLFQHLLFQLKYKGNRTIGTSLGKLLGHELLASQRFNGVDILVPSTKS